jgi:molybdenum cofactor cytidylyltransferase/nicotine blue oxidoreductase
MGAPKASLVLDGQRLVDRAVATLRAGGCEPVIAVVRPGADVPGGLAVINADPERGMRSSLALAVEAAGDADALAVLLVDTPGIGAEAVREVVAAWRPGRIAIAAYDGRRGHPTVMAPALWPAALAIAGADEGARALLRQCPDLVDEVAVRGDPADLDTPADVTNWQATQA